MKAVSPALQSAIKAGGKTLARCWFVMTPFGDTFGLTSHTRNIVFEGVTYLTSLGLFSTSSSSTEGFDVDNIDVTAFLDVTTEADLEAGKYDNSFVEIFDIDYLDLSAGKLIIKVGNLGEISRQDGRFTAEIRGLAQALFRKIGRLYLTTCDAQLGDGRCKVKLLNLSFTNDWQFVAATSTIFVAGFNPLVAGYESGDILTCSGTTSNDGSFTVDVVTNTDFTVVEAVVDESSTSSTILQLTDFAFNRVVDSVDVAAPRRIITIDSILGHDGLPLAQGFYKEGTITFISGLNRGIGRNIRVQSAAQLTCYEEFPFMITVADKVVTEAGCDKLFETCRDRFDNVADFRGFPHIGTPEGIFDSPVSY